MIESLLEAIIKANRWVEKFTRYEYRDAFKAYAEIYEPVYTAAVRQNENISALANGLLDALAQHRKKLHFWNRGAARAEEKMVVVSYLSPMLLGAEEAKCAEFARVLCAEWGARWPDDRYDMADFAEIIGGFRHAILGIDLAGKHMKKDRD